MRALSLLALSLLLSLSPSRAAAQTWDLSEYNRGLADRQRGDLTLTLYGDRLFSHAFQDPETHFSDRIPGNARVEMIVSIEEAPGTVWDGNPGREPIAEGHPARIGLILHRDWSTASGRWYSLARIEIRPGIHRLIVPLDGWAWKNVLGKLGNESAKHKETFRRTWTEPARIGLCGGGFFHGHGVTCTEGVGVIRVLSLRVRPRRRRRVEGRERAARASRSRGGCAAGSRVESRGRSLALDAPQAHLDSRRSTGAPRH